MREILFRGKRADNGEWVCGHYYTQGFHLDTIEEDWYHFIKPIGSKSWGEVRVIPETVGQYTGINVGNEKLFEGDIVEWHEDYDDTWGYSQTAVGRSVVVWDTDNFCWVFKTDGYLQPFNDWSWNNSYIIGNIHDNPELLEVGGNENAP